MTTIEEIILKVQQELFDTLNEDQMERLTAALNKHLGLLSSSDTGEKLHQTDMLSLFTAAKRVEGCSEKSLRYYESTIRNMLESISKPECQISTEDLRN